MSSKFISYILVYVYAISLSQGQVMSSICNEYLCVCEKEAGYTYVDCDLTPRSNQSINDSELSSFEPIENIETLIIRQTVNRTLPDNLLSRLRIRLMEAIDLGLESLSPNVFLNVQSIETLYLSLNRLSFIDFDRFPSNFTENLDSIDLSKNLFTSIPSFSTFKSLKYLDLSSNRIQQISNIENLPELEEIDLAGNLLRTINFSVFPENVRLSLKKLRLNANQIEYITELGDFHSLTYLSLHKNRIVQLGSNVFAGLPNLEALDLSMNQIKEISIDLFKGLVKLESLSLNGNHISRFTGGEFNDLRRVNLLELQHNNLEEFNFAWIKKMKVLITLDLSKNAIKTIEYDGVSLKKLYFLRLSENRLNYLGEPLEFAPNLKRLLIDNNQLSRLPQNISNLNIFDASNQNGKLTFFPNNALWRKKHQSGYFKFILDNNPSLVFAPKSLCFGLSDDAKKKQEKAEIIELFLSYLTLSNINVCTLKHLSFSFEKIEIYLVKESRQDKKILEDENHLICSCERRNYRLVLSMYNITVKNCENSKGDERKCKNDLISVVDNCSNVSC